MTFINPRDIFNRWPRVSESRRAMSHQATGGEPLRWGGSGIPFLSRWWRTAICWETVLINHWCWVWQTSSF